MSKVIVESGPRDSQFPSFTIQQGVAIAEPVPGGTISREAEFLVLVDTNAQSETKKEPEREGIAFVCRTPEPAMVPRSVVGSLRRKRTLPASQRAAKPQLDKRRHPTQNQSVTHWSATREE